MCSSTKCRASAAQNNPNLRIHLMGHSFGTIVVSSMIGGPNAVGPLPRPVDSVALRYVCVVNDHVMSEPTGVPSAPITLPETVT